MTDAMCCSAPSGLTYRGGPDPGRRPGLDYSDLSGQGFHAHQLSSTCDYNPLLFDLLSSLGNRPPSR